MAPSRQGTVYLVGAGPGDPELLTVRAAGLVRGAGTLVYDDLVGAGVLELAPAGCARLYVGKRSGRHSIAQGQINALLVRLARAGHDVVRLKGGDPFVFGRGAEEAEALAEAGIRFEVVPGITAASGMAARAGIPLTHRDLAQACLFVTAHLKEGSAPLDWPMLARPRQTVVFYMGAGSIDRICAELAAHGMDGATPAAVVQNATLPGQVEIAGTVATLPALAQAARIASPALVVVGQSVGLRARLRGQGSATPAMPRSAAPPASRVPVPQAATIS